MPEPTDPTKKLTAEEKLLKIKKDLDEMDKKNLNTIKDQLTALEEQEALYKRIAGHRGVNYLASLEKEQQYLQAKAEALREETELQQLIASMAEKQIISQETYDRIKNLSLEQLEDEVTSNKINNDLLREKIILTGKTLKVEKERKKNMDGFNKAAARAEGLIQSMGEKSILFSVNLNRMAEKLTKDLMDPGAMEAYGKEFRKQFLSIGNALASLSMVILEATVSLVKAADEAVTGFAAATGAGRAYNDVIVDVQRENNALGISMKDSADATAALMKHTSNYTRFSGAFQRALTKNTALLSKLGVTADKSGEMFNTLTLSLGMTKEQALEATTSIAMMGVELGIGPEQMTKDIQDSMATLSVYGQRAPLVFKNIAASAKAAGVATSDMLAVAKKFDTFEEASKTVAGLNALLGTQLTTTGMLMQTEDDRTLTVIKQLQTQGRAFKDMDRWQQKAIASQIGLGDDMNKARKILGMNVAGYESYKSQMDESNKAQEKLNEAVAAAIPITTKLTLLFQEFGVIVLPILETTHEVLDTILKVWKETPGPLKSTIKLVVIFGGVTSVAAKLMWPLVNAFMGLHAVSTGGTFLSGALGKGPKVKIPKGGLKLGLKGVGTSLMGLVKPLAAIAALAAAGYLIYKTVAGMGQMLDAFADWVSGSPIGAAADDMEKLEQTSVRAAAVLENITLLKTGRAANQITGESVMANVTNITTSMESIFPEKVKLVVRDREFEAYIESTVKRLAPKVVSQ